VTATIAKMGLQIDIIDSEMIDYLAKHEKANAGELAELIGIGVSSIRVRILKLMAQGLVDMEKMRDHRVFFFVTEKGAASCGNKMNGGGAGIPAKRYKNNVNVNSGQ
jgi:predicted ArsR family transcriptional regulator